MSWLKIVDEAVMFWQYPVCTEKQFCIQNDDDQNFLGFPWATIIDKNVTTESVHQFLRSFINTDKKYYTCCQHIYFRRLASLFNSLNIELVYTPHKCIGEDSIDGISLEPCPLYAVNIEDEHRNSIFRDVDLLNRQRDLLFSFMGGYQYGYISDIREKIFKLPSGKDRVITYTGDWHFNEVVYSIHQSGQGLLNESESRRDNTKIYNELLVRSRYSLCPSGSGPNSIRFWESLGAGSIPVLLADTLELPRDSRWKDSILRIEEKELENIDRILTEISEEEEFQRRASCLELYSFYQRNYEGLAHCAK